MQAKVKIIECPRDAMQGIHEFIPTQTKADYINILLRAGFDTIDFGSFVSPKAVPQLKDTAEVLSLLDLKNSSGKLLAIIANLRGAEDACRFPEISYLGFPFSVSETFQQRNTNSSIGESLLTVEKIQALCVKHGKELVLYLSMGFGNPYGDPWSKELVYHWTKKMSGLGIKIISLSDTVGTGDVKKISEIFSHLIPAFPEIEFGAHLHSNPATWKEKVEAAWNGGCRRFDSAIKGFGGCPMAEDVLVGNIATENLLRFLEEKNGEEMINKNIFAEALLFSSKVFPS